MNLLLINNDELHADGQFVVRDTRVAHIRKVLKLEKGERLKAGIIGGTIGSAEILSIDQHEVQLIFRDKVDGTAPQPIELIIALPRPQIFKRILEFAASVAVRKITFINAARVESSYFQAGVLDDETIQRHLLLGMEQGVSTYLPKVEVLPKTTVLRNLQSVVGDLSELTICHPTDNVSPIAKLPSPLKLVIGPEGGWTAEELNIFRTAGAGFISLSPYILRTDNAVVYAIAACSK